MTNLALRLLVFAIGLPLLGLAIFALPGLEHPFFALLVCVAAALAAHETASFFSSGALRYRGRRIVLPALGALLPAVAYGSVHGLWSADAILFVLVVAVALVLTVQILRRDKGEFLDILPAVESHVFVLIYPGLFASYAVRMLEFPMAGRVVLVFVLAVYLNDSTAYVTGRLFGHRRPRDREFVVPISPNKSLAGFLGGMTATFVVLFTAAHLWPDEFGGTPLETGAIAVLIGTMAIVGDLVESALKRSASIKDSGSLIPGRGGLLDSVDSPLFAAPIYYYAYELLSMGRMV